MFPQCKCCDIFLIIRSSEPQSDDKDIPRPSLLSRTFIKYDSNCHNATNLASPRTSLLCSLTIDRSLSSVCFQVQSCWYSISQGGPTTSGAYHVVGSEILSGEIHCVYPSVSGMMYGVMLECVTVTGRRNVRSRRCPSQPSLLCLIICSPARLLTLISISSYLLTPGRWRQLTN